MRQLRGFLVLTSYYRRFVPQYAHLEASLTDLLWKQAFVWTPAATTAFEDLKSALTSTPVLWLPLFDRPFEIQTDASSTSIGVILLQDQHPLAYFSKALITWLQVASTYAREIYAITEAVWWWQYLLVIRFIIYTDHQSLHYLIHQNIQTSEQHKWLI